MYPRITYDLPILSMDLVANNDMVSGLSGGGRCGGGAGLIGSLGMHSTGGRCGGEGVELAHLACDMWTHGGSRVRRWVELAHLACY